LKHINKDISPNSSNILGDSEDFFKSTEVELISKHLGVDEVDENKKIVTFEFKVA